MPTGISLQTFESFFSMPDVSSDNLSEREIQISSSQWVAQVFQARSDTLPSIYFMAYFASNDDISSLSLELREATNSYEIDGQTVLGTTTLSLAMRLPKDRGATEDKPYWYNWSTSASLTEGNFYAIIFKTSTSKTP